jgi:hypothetical protein
MAIVGQRAMESMLKDIIAKHSGVEDCFLQEVTSIFSLSLEQKVIDLYHPLKATVAAWKKLACKV